MTAKPEYFDRIRQRSEKRWSQLEADPELAGPWHQLFKQVQSPRHVLSELLQNADDARATHASVRIDAGVFTFSHNGEDFTEEHFASLCRFGYSNKRALHTIGFRGIGFKSTFSLGDCVELFTPTLSAQFERTRFTEPAWRTNSEASDGQTLVRVQSVDRRRQKELEKNFHEWLTSSKSLLFFRNLRRIDIGEQSIHWRKKKNGPVPDSEWVALDDAPDDCFLHIRSCEESFPEEALEEIRQERLLAVDEKTVFPPCRVEIVLGGGGRLYVVLPTGVETDLPFACNAPFIQDPARLKIKDPETSPTNRWLLARCGRLAAESMLKWLENRKLTIPNRADAYALVPDLPTESSALDAGCAAIVANAFAEALQGEKVLLAEDGALTLAKASVCVPATLLEVWPQELAMSLLDTGERPPLCRTIQDEHKARLVEWDWVKEIDATAFLTILRYKRIPKPETWPQLLLLWAFVAPEFIGYRRRVYDIEELQLVPVQGKRHLYAAASVVRLGEKKLLHAEDDWDFLGQYLLVLNQKWTRFLTEQKRHAEERDDQGLIEAVAHALALLDDMRLAEATDVDDVLATVFAKFFGTNDPSANDAVRLTQIAAKLGAAVDDNFRFRTRDGLFRAPAESVLFDADGTLEPLLPKTLRETRLLHADYTKRYTSCSKDDWSKWIASGRPKLHTFVPFVEVTEHLGGRRYLDSALHARGYLQPVTHRYRDPYFFLKDWDFYKGLWPHWEEIQKDDPQVWANVAERIFAEREAFWSRCAQARVGGLSNNGYSGFSPAEGIPPKWVMKLRDKPCLMDTRGFRQKPGDLLRRTPETESLLDVESFIHGRLDTERNRGLLDLLGVQSVPTGPDRLLGMLSALAKAKKPPIREVEKWYARLDQMMDSCSTEVANSIRKAFRTDKIILTEDGTWTTAKGVFLFAAEDDAPGAAVVRASVNDLTLWSKVGVADRPTVELALEWLKGLPSGEALSQEDARRVRGLLARHPVRLFVECEHWLSLAGTWEPVSALRFAVTMQSLTPWQHLHEWVKKQTADLRDLPGEVTGAEPFSVLPPLAAAVEERFSIPPASSTPPEHKSWLAALGTELARIELDSEVETVRVRGLARRITRTRWHRAEGVEIIPYIDGKPAGIPRATDVVWIEDALYVGHLSKAKLARRVPEELNKAFGRTDIKAALDYSFERGPEDVREYLEENFQLAERPQPETERPLLGETDEEVSFDESATWADEPGATPELDESPVFAESITSPLQSKDFSEPLEDAPEEEFLGNGGRPAARRPPTKPPLAERFALGLGFQKVDNRRFVRDDGQVLERATDSSFPWEHRDGRGGVLRRYWASEHCLERQPLQVDADVWGLIEKYPNTYALILTDPDGAPTEVTGEQLVSMREQGHITLYPAAYRLVQTQDSLHA